MAFLVFEHGKLLPKIWRSAKMKTNDVETLLLNACTKNKEIRLTDGSQKRVEE